MNFFERFLLEKFKLSDLVNPNENISELEKTVKEKRDRIYAYFNQNRSDSKMEILREDFIVYTQTLEKVILARRIESGISTLIYFLYTLLGDIVGIVFAIAVFISTSGYIGHIILLISMGGNIAGVVIAIRSMKKERKFINSLKKGI